MNALKTIWIAATALIGLTLVAGCASAETNTGLENAAPSTQPPSSDTVQVVASFTILADMAREIGGDLVDVHTLVPTGTDPHEYEPLPDDIKATHDADLLLMNGLNLEGGADGWFTRLVEATGQDVDRIVEASDGIEPLMLGTDPEDGPGAAAEVNPHSFVDPVNGILMAERVRDGLIAVDPDRAAEYEERGASYLAELEALAADYHERLSAIPEEERILVTSERAFQYLAARYDIREAFIWEIDTDETGSVQQITELLEFIEANPVRSLVIESNVDRRPMEMISAESGVPIFDRPIFSDEIGTPDDEVNTYLAYLRYNLDVIAEALTRQRNQRAAPRLGYRHVGVESQEYVAVISLRSRERDRPCE